MEGSAEEESLNLSKVKDCVAHAIELLEAEDIFGAVLELQRARSLLGSTMRSRLKEASEVHHHDWCILDPYIAQCRLCGRRRPLGVEDRTLMPLAL